MDKYEKKIRDYLNSSEVDPYQKGMLADLFPELMESEDEKIRKRIKYFINATSKGEFEKYAIIKEDAIAWLEKQGEQKPVVIPKFRIGDIIRWKKADSLVYTIKEITDKGYINTADGIMDISQTDIEFELVEQKPEWSEEDETNNNRLLYFLNGGGLIAGRREELFDWLKSIKERVQPQLKQEWSEEDEEIVEALNDYVKNLDILFSEIKIGNKDILSKEFREKVQSWLKSLKDRVQPKQEWNEEDERIRRSLILELERFGANTKTDSTSPNYSFTVEIKWLKSLRPQNHWKPSDNQKKALKWVLQNIPYNIHKEEISGLLDQIKEL